jgi:hypothetical protein
MDKEVPLSEPKASCGRFPFFDLHKRGPEGQRSAVAFFGIPFLATQERYVAAGLLPAGNLKITPEHYS